MSEPNSARLSPEGQARREAMLDELVGVLKHTHTVRRRRKRIVTAGACACLALLVARLIVPDGLDKPEHTRIMADKADPVPAVAPRPPAAETGMSARPRVCVAKAVSTDPKILDRYRAEPTGRIARMNDRMLVNALASINRPAGLIRFGSRARLTAPVSDAELGLNH